MTPAAMEPVTCGFWPCINRRVTPSTVVGRGTLSPGRAATAKRTGLRLMRSLGADPPCDHRNLGTMAEPVARGPVSRQGSSAGHVDVACVRTRRPLTANCPPCKHAINLGRVPQFAAPRAVTVSVEPIRNRRQR